MSDASASGLVSHARTTDVHHLAESMGRGKAKKAAKIEQYGSRWSPMYWADWCGTTGIITALVTVLLVIASMWLMFTGSSDLGNYAMTGAVLIGSVSMMAIWFRRVEEDGCDPCVKSILEQVAKDAATAAVGAQPPAA